MSVTSNEKILQINFGTLEHQAGELSENTFLFKLGMSRTVFNFLFLGLQLCGLESLVDYWTVCSHEHIFHLFILKLFYMYSRNTNRTYLWAVLRIT